MLSWVFPNFINAQKFYLPIALSTFFLNALNGFLDRNEVIVSNTIKTIFNTSRQASKRISQNGEMIASLCIFVFQYHVDYTLQLNVISENCISLSNFKTATCASWLLSHIFKIEREFNNRIELHLVTSLYSELKRRSSIFFVWFESHKLIIFFISSLTWKLLVNHLKIKL